MVSPSKAVHLPAYIDMYLVYILVIPRSVVEDDPTTVTARIDFHCVPIK